MKNALYELLWDTLNQGGHQVSLNYIDERKDPEGAKQLSEMLNQIKKIAKSIFSQNII